MVISIVFQNRNCRQKVSLGVVLNVVDVSVLLLWCLLIVKMELFSLEEEDDYRDIFITQTPKVQEVGNEGNSAKDGQF